LDKNPNQEFELKIKPILEQNNLNSILCDEPFHKASLIERIIQNSDVPILYLDFDLLYSGFISANILIERKNLHLYRPTCKELESTLKIIIEKISSEKSLVIIDSLNGFYNVFDEKNSGRLINSYIMLLAFVAKSTNSQIILTSMARINEKKFWVLSPTGRQIITSASITNIHLKRSDSKMLLNLLDEKNSIKDSIKIFN